MMYSTCIRDTNASFIPPPATAHFSHCACQTMQLEAQGAKAQPWGGFYLFRSQEWPFIIANILYCHGQIWSVAFVLAENTHEWIMFYVDFAKYMAMGVERMWNYLKFSPAGGGASNWTWASNWNCQYMIYETNQGRMADRAYEIFYIMIPTHVGWRGRTNVCVHIKEFVSVIRLFIHISWRRIWHKFKEVLKQWSWWGFHL